VARLTPQRLPNFRAMALGPRSGGKAGAAYAGRVGAAMGAEMRAVASIKFRARPRREQ